MPLISVVIPVHGVADYLDRCLDSILGEPGPDDPAVAFEVIAVDDASPDRSGEILAARDDPRLRVITTPVAGGPGSSPRPGRQGGQRGSTCGSSTVTTRSPRAGLAAVAEALTRLRPDVLVVDFAYLYPDGAVSPSGGAGYLRGAADRHAG